MKLCHAAWLAVWFLLYPHDPYRAGPVSGYAELGRYHSFAECKAARTRALAQEKTFDVDNGIVSELDPEFVGLDMAECRSSDDREVKLRQQMIDTPFWSLRIPLQVGQDRLDANASISEWKVLSTYDSATNCEKEKENTINKANAMLKADREQAQSAVAAALATATCVSANDPRLNAK